MVVALCAIHINENLAAAEINFQGCFVVDAAQIADKHAVNVHPHVVVAGELVGDLPFLRLIGMTAILLHKPGAHCHTQMVIAVFFLKGIVIDWYKIAIPVSSKDFFPCIKWEKLTIG